MPHASLIHIPISKPNASLRLICFPYAGGNSMTYIKWLDNLSTKVELALVQLPGRGVRSAEPPYQTMEEVVRALFLELGNLSNKPTIFYGHSMGARVAYELTLMLLRFQYKLPIHFIASGSIAPSVSRKKEYTYNLPDDDFIKKIAELNGSQDEVLAHKEIMQLLMPALRADFKIIETYCNKSKAVIPTKISVLAGTEEDTEHPDIEAWFNLFQSNTGIHWISGDHFFVDKNKPDLLKTVNNLIADDLIRLNLTLPTS
jgi:medium-chain acyl-[acyl-carrier-protein] hydrolase